MRYSRKNKSNEETKFKIEQIFVFPSQVSIVSGPIPVLYRRHVTLAPALCFPSREPENHTLWRTTMPREDKNGERRAVPFPRNNVNSTTVRAVTRFHQSLLNSTFPPSLSPVTRQNRANTFTRLGARVPAHVFLLSCARDSTRYFCTYVWRDVLPSRRRGGREGNPSCVVLNYAGWRRWKRFRRIYNIARYF